MIPRQQLDIGWCDLLTGLIHCGIPTSGDADRAWMESTCGNPSSCVAALSVRSGFDALLSVLAFPVGSEILVSAITIRDMARIIAAHQLVAVPIDVDPDRLDVAEQSLQRAITPRTKAILVAHLFGSRMSLEGVMRIAEEHRLLVIEDCAQAYIGAEYRGHPRSDVSCFSFGPIKTATALGGSVLRFRDPLLADQVRHHVAVWPCQTRFEYGARLIKYAGLKLLNGRLMFTILVALLRACGWNHDQFLSRSVRGFAAGDFFLRIRRRPSAPLLKLLARRLRQSPVSRIEHRRHMAQAAIQSLPPEVLVGSKAENHSHWVFPIRVACPDELIHALWKAGFDATRGASSMAVIEATSSDQPPATAAARLMGQILYLPIAACRDVDEVKRLADCVGAHTT